MLFPYADISLFYRKNFLKLYKWLNVDLILKILNWIVIQMIMKRIYIIFFQWCLKMNYRGFFKIRVLILLTYEDSLEIVHLRDKTQLVDAFYDEVANRYNTTPYKIDYNQFRVSDDSKTLYLVEGDKEIRMSANKVNQYYFSWFNGKKIQQSCW